MSTYICKCGRRVKKSTNADNTGNRLEGYGPGHECYGCPYVLSWGNYEWNEEAKSLEQKAKGYECRMSKTLAYDSRFIGSTKDKCTCSVVSLDFDFLEQISSWVKKTFTSGELTGYFSRGEIRATDYCHNGRYQYTLCCAQNKKGIAAKAALFEHFFNSGGSRKDMTPQQEMEKVLADIKKATQAKEKLECTTMDSAAPSENADASSATGGAPLTTGTTLMTKPAHSAPQDKTPTSFPMNSLAAPTFDFSALGDLSGQAAEADQQFDLHYGAAQDEYLISCIYLARIHALTAKAGRYGGGTWTKWYESKGMSKSSVWNMLQTGEGFKGSTVEQLTSIPELSRKDLNLIARSGCAEQLTAAAGDSQRVQELLAQLKAEKSRADTAEAHLEAAHADINGLTERAQKAESERDKARADQLSTAKDCNRLGLKVSQEKDRADKAEAREEEARKAAHEYHEKYEEAAAMRATLLDQQGVYIADIDGLKKQNTKLKQIYRDEYESRIAANLQRQKAEGERDRAEERAKNAEDALKKQPITAVIDEEEIDRRAAEKAWGLADARNAELAKDNANLKKQVAALRSRINDDAQADFEQANYCASLMRAAWDNSKASYSRLVGEDLESTFQTICGTLNSIMEEASLLCRQPPDYDGGDRDE